MALFALIGKKKECTMIWTEGLILWERKVHNKKWINMKMKSTKPEEIRAIHTEYSYNFVYHS